ncbi:MAG: hypothetical protein AAFN07_10415 [Pseudomonadota bacterium]
MNRRTLVVAMAASMGLASSLAFAGSPDGPGRRHMDPEARVERMTELLGLDSNQAATIEAILQEAEAQRLAIGDRYTLNQRDEAKAEFKALREQTRAQVEEQLTPDQIATLEAAKADRRERRRSRRMHRRDRQVEPEESVESQPEA